MSQNYSIEVKTIAEGLIKKPIPFCDKNLFDEGLIDSLNAVNLLVTIEEKIGISFDILDFANREQFTIDNIAKLVAVAKAKKSS